MCNFPEMLVNTTLTLVLSWREREPEVSESPSLGGAGLG